MQRLLDRADGWVKQVARGKERDPKQLIQAAYLRALSRLPSEQEAGIASKYLEGRDTVAGVRDLLWALLNTKEFIVNR